MILRFAALALCLCLCPLVATSALAEDAPVQWTLKGSTFDPPILEIAAKTTFTLKFTNTNAVQAELECKGLKIEKPVVAGGSIMVRVLNAKPGTYDCVDEPHEDVAKGQIVIK